MGSFSASFQNKSDKGRLPRCLRTKEREPRPLRLTSSCLGPSLLRQPGEPREAGGQQQGPQGADSLHQGAAAGARGRVCSSQLSDPAPEIRDRSKPGPLRAAGAPPLLAIPPFLCSVIPLSSPASPRTFFVVSLCPSPVVLNSGCT